MMTFQTFSTNAAYKTFRQSVLLNVEEGGVPKTIPYLDGKQIPTMGIGFNLRVSANLDAILTEMGFNLNATGKESEYINAIRGAVRISYSDISNLNSYLNQVMSLWSADTTVTTNKGLKGSCSNIFFKPFLSVIHDFCSRFPGLTGYIIRI